MATQELTCVCGVRYRNVEIGPEDIAPGAMVRFENGSVVRRIVGTDGADIILRGVRSTDVFEAICREKLLEEWLLLVPSQAAAE